MTTDQRTNPAPLGLRARCMACNIHARRWLGLVFALLSVVGCTTALAGERLALVLIAEDYVSYSRSPIGKARGAEIADALTALGFRTVVKTNPTSAEARARLQDVAEDATNADLALVVLVGHGVTSAGQTFFIPVNVEISRASDVLSRGLSVAAIAHIVSRATNGSVLVLPTVPQSGPVVQGLDSRPQLPTEIAPNVTIAFATSGRLPVSRFDAASAAAVESLVAALRKPGVTLREIVDAVTGDDSGQKAGVASAMPLLAPPPPKEVSDQGNKQAADAARKEAALAEAARVEADRLAKDSERKLAAEQEARRALEKKLEEQEAKAANATGSSELSTAELEKARAETATAKAQAQEAQTNAASAAAKAEQGKIEAETAKLQAEAALATARAEADRAQADALLAKAAAEKARLEAETAQMQAQAEADKARLALEEAKKQLADQANAKQPAPALPALPPGPVDTELGEKQRILIQERLRDLGLYIGKLDGKMGPLMREAILGYQRNRGDDVTGYLSPEQYAELTATGSQ
jgi:Putative peptidoglycan binding domain/Caspase domain